MELTHQVEVCVWSRPVCITVLYHPVHKSCWKAGDISRGWLNYGWHLMMLSAAEPFWMMMTVTGTDELAMSRAAAHSVSTPCHKYHKYDEENSCASSDIFGIFWVNLHFLWEWSYLKLCWASMMLRAEIKWQFYIPRFVLRQDLLSSSELNLSYMLHILTYTFCTPLSHCQRSQMYHLYFAF